MLDEPVLALARFAMLAALLLLAGYPLYLGMADGSAIGRRGGLALAGLAVTAMALSIWWAVASVAAMAALPVQDLDRATVMAVLDATPIGTALQWRLIALTAFATLAIIWPRALMLAMLGLIALAAHAWTGHAGAGEGAVGDVLRAFDVIHLSAAALWLGALVYFLKAIAHEDPARGLVARLERFARTGTAIVVLLALTGAFNAFVIAGNGWQTESGWTILLAAKLVFFTAMLGFAAVNRWRLAPALKRGETGAEGRLARSLVMETACMMAVIACVAALGLLDPAGG